MEFDPKAWADAAATLKSGFDMFRSAIGFAKDLRGGSTPAEQETFVKALAQASTTATIAEAQIAHALGYQLCKCTFPPTPMLTVGFKSLGHPKELRGPVYECPKCGITNVGAHNYNRTAPPRDGS